MGYVQPLSDTIHDLLAEHVHRSMRERLRRVDEMARYAQEVGCGLVYADDYSLCWPSDAVDPGTAVIFPVGTFTWTLESYPPRLATPA